VLVSLPTAALALVVVGLLQRDDRAAEPEPAQLLHSEALQQLAQMDWAAMAHALAAAHRAKPTYVPALIDLLLSSSGEPPPPLRAALDSVRGDSGDPLAPCANALRSAWTYRAVAPDSSAMAQDCATAARVFIGDFAESRDGRARNAASLLDRYPESLVLARTALTAAVSARAWQHVERVATVARRSPDPAHQIVSLIARAMALHAASRHTDAGEMESEARSLGRRGPGLTMLFRWGLGHHLAVELSGTPVVPPAHADSVAEEFASLWTGLLDQADPWSRAIWAEGELRGKVDEGDPAAALRDIPRASWLADSLGDPLLQAGVQLFQGRAALKMGRLQAAEASLLAARDLAIDGESLPREYDAEHNLLHLYEATGRDREARRAGRAFIKLTGEAPLFPVRMMSYHDLGWYLRRRGEWEEARRLLDSMVVVINALDDRYYESYFFAGEYFESVGELDSAAAYYQRNNASAPNPRALEAMARLAEFRGDTGAALRYASELDALAVKFYSESRPLRPGILARMGRLAEATAGLEAARVAASQRGQRASWARLTYELASVWSRRGSPGAAAALGDSAAAAAEEVSDVEVAVEARALAAASRVRAGAAETAEALRQLSQARTTAHRMHHAGLAAAVALLEGEALANAGSVDRAFSALRDAHELSDSMARSLESDVARAHYRSTQHAASSRALTLAVDRRSDARAVGWWMEWSHRRKDRGVSERSPGARSSARLESPWPRRLADPSVAVIDYVMLDSAVAALVMTNQGTDIMRLEVTPAQIRGRLSRLYAGFAPRLGSYVDQRRARFDGEVARLLFQDLLAPLEPLIRERRRLVVMPDGPLFLIPFDALIAGDLNGNPVYALERWTIELAVDVSVAPLRERMPPNGPMLLVAAATSPALRAGTEREVLAVTSAWRDRTVTVLRDGEATEEAVRRGSRDAGILHVTAHARPSAVNPDLAEIRLYPSPEHDGRLHALEIRTLPLRDALVVLSACETAAGPVAASEGPLSLSRAFFQAGAGQVIATLSPVGDAAELMAQFYRGLETGRPVAESLREAKLALYRTGVGPLTWAPFVLLSRGN